MLKTKPRYDVLSILSKWLIFFWLHDGSLNVDNVVNNHGLVSLGSISLIGLTQLPILCIVFTTYLNLPYLTFRVGRLLHLPSAEAVSVRPNAQPRCNQRSQWLAVKPNKSPATWDWWPVVWLFLPYGSFLVDSSPPDFKSFRSSEHKPHQHVKVADTTVGMSTMLQNVHQEEMKFWFNSHD